MVSTTCKLQQTVMLFLVVIFLSPVIVQAYQLEHEHHNGGYGELAELAAYIDRVFANPRTYEAFPKSRLGRTLLASGPVINVVDKGARGDGVTDDSAAFQWAFAAVCSRGGTVQVPQGGTFYISHLEVADCKGVTFQVDGTLLAPASSKDYPDTRSWLHFSFCEHLRIVGKGTMDARGQWGWGGTFSNFHAIYIERSSSVLVRDLVILHAPRFSLYIEHNENVLVEGITVNNSVGSLATDCIHFSHCSKFIVRNNDIQSGDDCIVMQTQIDTALVTGNRCTGTHGIGVGSSHDTPGCIRNVVVEGNTFINGRYGCRIKGWTNTTGAVTNYICRNNVVKNVELAIRIDMEYCNLAPSGSCGALGHLLVYNALFLNITGTSSSTSGYSMKCGEKCGVALYNIQVTPEKKDARALTPVCANMYGVAENVSPPSCINSPSTSMDLQDSAEQAASCNFPFPNGGYHTPRTFSFPLALPTQPNQDGSSTQPPPPPPPPPTCPPSLSVLYSRLLMASLFVSLVLHCYFLFHLHQAKKCDHCSALLKNSSSSEAKDLLVRREQACAL